MEDEQRTTAALEFDLEALEVRVGLDNLEERLKEGSIAWGNPQRSRYHGFFVDLNVDDKTKEQLATPQASDEVEDSEGEHRRTWVESAPIVGDHTTVVYPGEIQVQSPSFVFLY